MAGSGTVMADLQAAGEELVARVGKLRDVLAGSADLAQDAIADIKNRLGELAVDIDTLIEDVETADEADDDQEEEGEEGADTTAPV